MPAGIGDRRLTLLPPPAPPGPAPIAAQSGFRWPGPGGPPPVEAVDGCDLSVPRRALHARPSWIPAPPVLVGGAVLAGSVPPSPRHHSCTTGSSATCAGRRRSLTWVFSGPAQDLRSQKLAVQLDVVAAVGVEQEGSSSGTSSASSHPSRSACSHSATSGRGSADQGSRWLVVWDHGGVNPARLARSGDPPVQQGVQPLAAAGRTPLAGREPPGWRPRGGASSTMQDGDEPSETTDAD